MGRNSPSSHVIARSLHSFGLSGLRHRSAIGGADGIRTHDLLDAIEARSQLRHGPTGMKQRKPFYMSAKAASTTSSLSSSLSDHRVRLEYEPMAKLTFLGAAGSVTGSKYLVEAAGKRLLVDCGIFQGSQELQ